jgi:hypothetical protein
MRRAIVVSGLLLAGTLVLGQEKAGDVVVREGEAAAYQPGEKITVKTKKGQEFKDAEIVNAGLTGIDIAYSEGDATLVRHLNFRDLPESVQKRFGYDPAKVEAHEKKVHERFERLEKEKAEAIKHHADMEAMLGAHRAKAVKDAATVVPSGLEKEISGRGMKVQLKVYWAHPDGIVAWAAAPDHTVTTGNYGKVFVYGLHSEQGNVWDGTIYPTGLQMHGYPCFTTRIELAVGLAQAQK